MSEKVLPFTPKQLESILREFPTPVYVYDERGIRESARKLNEAFSWVPNGFKNYFAVKALPNPYILEILKEEGSGADCSSMPELMLAQMAGISGQEVMFTSNDTPAAEFKKAKEIGAIINLDDIKHIDFLESHAGLPDLICFRYNPGSARTGNSIIGIPAEAKYGLTKDQIFEAYKIMKAKGVKRFGLHTMVASNSLMPHHFIETASMIFDLAVEISKKEGVKFEFLNLGGGIGIPYAPHDEALDLEFVSNEIRKEYDARIAANGLHPLRIVMECGRFITGPHGYLFTTVRHVTQKYRNYVGVDASMANLMRPAMYDAYHHITVLGKEHLPHDQIYDITGSLCENNDKFAKQRKLPRIEVGNTLGIFDVGAHGHAMGFQYNGKLRSAEVLAKENGENKLIRRAETIDDYFATLNHPNLRLVTGG